MSRAQLRLWLLVPALIAPLCGVVGSAGSVEDSFLEALILGDRNDAIEMLTPGSADFYFYSALNAQLAGDEGRFDRILKEYRRKSRSDPRIQILQNRQLFQLYDQKPNEVRKRLIKMLGLVLNHAPALTESNRRQYSARLNSHQIDTATLVRKYAKGDSPRSHFTPEGLPALYEALPAHGAGRRALLARSIIDPTLPGVLEDLAHFYGDDKQALSYGHFKVERYLFLNQLRVLAEEVPRLLEEKRFVEAWLGRLRAEADAPESDQDAALDRQLAFVRRLSPRFSSLKAALLFLKLSRNLKRGIYDEELFCAYLALPHDRAMFSEDHRRAAGNFPVNLMADWASVVGRGPIRDDETLVQAHLDRLFARKKKWSQLTDQLSDPTLRQAFARAKILSGDRAPKYFEMLSEDAIHELTESTYLAFAPTNPKRFKIGDPVALDLTLKNVDELTVRVFRVNAKNFYRDTGEEISKYFDVLGLRSSDTRTFPFSYPSSTQHTERVSFEKMSRPGVYIIDVSGNGKQARALVRIGHLHIVHWPTASGIVFVVLDAERQTVEGAQLLIDGHEFVTDETGRAQVPYSAEDTPEQTVVVSKGDVTNLYTFHHRPPEYTLTAGILVEQEALLPGSTARLLVSPRLWAESQPVSLRSLSEVMLEVKTLSHDQLCSVMQFEVGSVSDSSDLVREFVVPPNLKVAVFTLSGKVRVPWEDEKRTLTVSQTIQGVSDRDPTHFGQVLFDRVKGEYRVHVLGMNGEPMPNRIVALRVWHAFLRSPEQVILQTDSDGVIALGRLQDIRRVVVMWNHMSWELLLTPPDVHLPSDRFVATGSGIAVPYSWKHDLTGGKRNPQPGDFHLYRQTNRLNVCDATAALSITPNQVTSGDLAPGRYVLEYVPSGMKTEIEVGAFARNGWLSICEGKVLRDLPPSSLTIKEVTEKGDVLRIKLSGITATTRVHVFGRHFCSDMDPIQSLAANYAMSSAVHSLELPVIRFRNSEDTNDEDQYVLDRARRPHYAGNLLERPGLLLNPTETNPVEHIPAVLGMSAGSIHHVSMADCLSSLSCSDASNSQSGGPPGRPFLEFLAAGPTSWLNMIPDQHGVLEIDLDVRGHLQSVCIVALDLFAVRSVDYDLRSPKSLRKRDLRLAHSLPVDVPLRQELTCSALRTGETFVTGPGVGARYVVYDDLARLYQLMHTLNNTPHLEAFDFVVRWHELSEAKKRALYSTYACHELSFFLYHKDSAFFRAVIKPYLANKLSKTFMDHYLLGDDLAVYRDPYRYSRLNLAERILLDRRCDVDSAERTRYVHDLVSLKPTPRQEVDRIIRAALGAFALTETSLIEKTLGQLEGQGVRQALALQSKALAKGTQLFVRGGRSNEVAMAIGYDDLGERREQDGAFFVNVGDAMEYMENNYYKLPPREQNADLIPAGPFWEDVAASDTGVLSAHVAEAAHNFTEIMLAMALTDLPFTADDHTEEIQPTQRTLTMGSNALVFARRLRSVKDSTGSRSSLLVAQRYFVGKVGSHSSQQEDPTPVREPFCSRQLYSCNVTIINPTEREKVGDILVQIPEGAIGLTFPQAVHGERLELAAHSMEHLQYVFYFPQAGCFVHTPVRVNIDGESPVLSQKRQLEVVVGPQATDLGSWDDIAIHGTDAEVIEYLTTSNVAQLDLDRINFRLGRRDFFSDYMNILMSRHHFHRTGYGYSFVHSFVPGMRRYLRETHIAGNVGGYFRSGLLNTNAIQDGTYHHLDYAPLILARTHAYSGRTRIPLKKIQQQYDAYLDMMSYKDSVTDVDRIQLVYYFLLQNRVSDALKLYRQIDSETVSLRLQYDYLNCYLSFFLNDRAAARTVAERYADYPIDRWRHRFEEVLRQLGEAEGTATSYGEGRESRLSDLAAADQMLDIEMDDDRLIVFATNIDTFTVNLYEMDIEMLFSQSPFVERCGKRFSYVDPSHSFDVVGSDSPRGQIVELPEAFRNRNLFVEVRSSERRTHELLLRSDLRVDIAANYGRLTVFRRDEESRLPSVYVKVYAELEGGRTQFHKDGYTDVRGTFDYTSLLSGGLSQVKRFAILVLSEEFGALVLTVDPPKE